MIDANSQFFAILTNVGMAKLANATALGVSLAFTHMGVGDANNTDPIPSAAQTSLVNEWRRQPLNQVRVDPVNPAVIIAEQIIPADVGGRWIREIGLYDADGDLVAVANCAPSFKPVLSQGSGRTQVVRMNFIVASTGNITLKIDPAVVLATREYVDTRIMEELYKLDSKQSVRVATTANIALAGLQTIDGVALVAGDRVLVKNQAVAKDNGIYLAATAVWTRAPDADTNAEVTSALLTSVEQGATLADTRWQLVTDGVIVLGTTALTFQNVTQGFAPLNAPALINPTANTPAQFDSSQLLINSAFLKRRGVEFGDYTNYAASTALTVSDIGKVAAFGAVGAMTATLPTGATIPRGAVVKLLCTLGTLTVQAAAGDSIDAVNSPGNITMGQGDTAEFIRIGSLWRLIGGSVSLKYALVMSGPNWTTQPQFTADKSFATTEFVQRAQGNVRGSVSPPLGATALGAAHWGCLLLGLAGAKTWTLPLLSTVPDGTSFKFMNSSQPGTTITLVSSGADFVRVAGGPNSASEVFGPASFGTVIKYGDTWLVVDTPRALPYSDVFSGPNWTTQSQFTSDKSLATTEFVQREKGGFSGFTGFSASRSIAAADIGRVLWPSVASLTLTLPTPASLGMTTGMGLTVFATSYGTTLSAGAGASLQNLLGVGVPTIPLKAGQSAMVFAAGPSTWQIIYSTADLGNNADFAATLAGPTCWQKLPSGDVEQWGLANVASGAELVITLPVTMLAPPTNIELTFADFATSHAVGSVAILQARNSAAGSITVRNLYTAPSSFFWRVRGRA